MIDIAVYIGRFQPFHKGHLENCIQALSKAKKLIILIGSAGMGPLPNNPWSLETRADMILSTLPKELLPRVILLPLYDSLYDQIDWEKRVKNLIQQHANPNDRKALVVFAKDDSSFYLECFPEWEQINLPMVVDAKNQCINATNIRAELYAHDTVSDEVVPTSVKKIILASIKAPFYKAVKHANQVLNAYQATNQVLHLLVLCVNGDAMVHRCEDELGCQQWALPMFIDQSKLCHLLQSIGADPVKTQTKSLVSSLLKLTYEVTYLKLEDAFDMPEGYQLFSKSRLMQEQFFADHRSILYQPMNLSY